MLYWRCACSTRSRQPRHRPKFEEVKGGICCAPRILPRAPCCFESPARPECGNSDRLTCESPRLHPQFARALGIGGIHVTAPKPCAWRDARHGAVDRATADEGSRLHARATAGLHARCHADLRRLHPGRRPNHGLHDPESVAALAGMPALLSGRTRAPRSRGRPAGSQADGHQAGGCEDEEAEAQEESKAGNDLIASSDGLRHDPEKCEAVFRKDHAQTRS